MGDAEGRGGDDAYDETRYALMSRAKGVALQPADTPEDRHPGFDLKARVRKPRHAPVDVESEDIRAHRYTVGSIAWRGTVDTDEEVA